MWVTAFRRVHKIAMTIIRSETATKTGVDGYGHVEVSPDIVWDAKYGAWFGLILQSLT